jgi:hypothetical protein
MLKMEISKEGPSVLVLKNSLMLISMVLKLLTMTLLSVFMIKTKINEEIGINVLHLPTK